MRHQFLNCYLFGFCFFKRGNGHPYILEDGMETKAVHLPVFFV